MGKLNVAIADDNEVMRDLLEEMVTSDDELHLIGMAKDGEGWRRSLPSDQGKRTGCCIIGYYYAETGRFGSP